MFHEIETVELYFPGGNQAFYKVGKSIQIPTPKRDAKTNEVVYAMTDMIVMAITVSRLFQLVTIHLSNGERVEYTGVKFATTMGGFHDELEGAVQRKVRLETEKQTEDTPSEPTESAEPAGEAAPPVGDIEQKNV